jgi:septum formation protein
MGLVLASASPRRKELLSLVTADFVVDPPLGSEKIDESLPARRIAAILAEQKAHEVFARHPRDVVLGADTVVVLDGTVLGKPADRRDAMQMLGLLSGRTHRVYTGVCLLAPGGKHVFAVWADVTFAQLTPKEKAAYLLTGEGDDKAGAYAVQGLGARFIKKVDGDFYAVVGLPVHAVYQTLFQSPFINYLL